VARRVLDAARASGKPVVVCFLGGDPAAIRASGAHPAATLAEAARLAVALAHGAAASEGGPAGPARGSDTGADTQAAGAPSAAPTAAAGLAASQWAIRGLYSGGTLCAEAELVVARVLGGRAAEAGHTLVDLGDDEYTVGRPHPMIDFRLRNERIAAAALDPATAVILLDVVLGYGSHPDPAGALVPALQEARARAASAGRSVLVIASVCGTASDPQDLVRQERQLRDAGVRLAPSNAEAARQAALAVRDTGHSGESRR